MLPSISVPRSTALVGVGALLVVLLLAGQRLSSSSPGGAADVAAPVEQVVAVPAQSALVVHVAGAVRRPGLYRLREGARVADALERAGGATRRAETAALNLAAPLVDGMQVLVPPRVEIAGAGSADGDSTATVDGSSASTAAGRPSLSSASAEELDALPGVGPVTAQSILEYRAEHGPFRSVDELDAVPGIGPARIEQLRELVTP